MPLEVDLNSDTYDPDNLGQLTKEVNYFTYFHYKMYFTYTCIFITGTHKYSFEPQKALCQGKKAEH